MKKKLLSILLCLCMLTAMLPASALAAETVTCENHPEHDGECGFVQGAECAWQHGDCCQQQTVCLFDAQEAENGEAEPDSEAQSHDCTVESGCITTVCSHVCSFEDCGCIEAQPCAHSCESCIQPPELEIPDDPDGDQLPDGSEQPRQDALATCEHHPEHTEDCGGIIDAGKCGNVCAVCVGRVQAMVDALPGMSQINDSNSAAVAAALEAISAELARLSDKAVMSMDMDKYSMAALALSAPGDWFKLAVQKIMDSPREGFVPSFSFVDVNGSPASFIDINSGAALASIDLVPNGAAEYYYLPAGTYSVVEHAQGYTMSLSLNGQPISGTSFTGVGGGDYIMTIDNVYNLHEVSLRAVDAASDQQLADVHIQLLNEAGAVVGETDSSDADDSLFRELSADTTYTLRVTAAADGYAIPADVSQFVINSDGSIEGVELENDVIIIRLNMTTVNVAAVNAADDTALAGAHIQLMDEDDSVIDEWDSTDAAYTVLGLSAGSYTVVNSVAPSGYEYADDISFELDEYGQISTDADTITDDSGSKVLLMKFDAAIYLSLGVSDDTTYNGSEQKPTVTVKSGDSTLTEGSDYEISYKRGGSESDDFTTAGVIAITVTGKGSYASADPVSGSYEIKKAPLVIRADNALVAKGYTGSFGYTTEGLAQGDSLVTEPVMNVVGGSLDTVGIYTLSPGSADAGGNYEISYESGTVYVSADGKLRYSVYLAPLSSVPAELQGVMSLDRIKTVLSSYLYTYKVYYYDAVLSMSVDGTNWVAVPDEFMPAGGVQVVWPYQVDASKNSFKVVHMFGESSQLLGTVAGGVEVPACTETSAGLVFTLKGCSPLAIGYRDSSIVYTGDSSDLMLWVLLTAATLGGIICTLELLRVRKRRS